MLALRRRSTHLRDARKLKHAENVRFVLKVPQGLSRRLGGRIIFSANVRRFRIDLGFDVTLFPDGVGTAPTTVPQVAGS